MILFRRTTFVRRIFLYNAQNISKNSINPVSLFVPHHTVWRNKSIIVFSRRLYPMKQFYTLALIVITCFTFQPELLSQNKSNWRDYVDISEARLLVKDRLGALMNRRI